MSIPASALKLVLPQDMTDYATGGGRLTAAVLPDAAVGALWPQVSRNDRARGRTSLRKLGLQVDTADTALLAGAGLLLTDPPADPHVSVVMFATAAAHYDTRTAAQEYVESYLVPGPDYDGAYLYNSPVQGQAAIAVLQRPEKALPAIGNTWVLSDATGTQAIKISALSSELRTYSDAQGSWQALYLLVEFSPALRRGFTGSAANRYFIPATGAARILTTLPANAARYYGVSPLAQAASADSLSVRVASISAAIVPAAQGETAVTDASPGGATEYIAIGTGQSATTSQWKNGGIAAYYVPGAILPGSLSMLRDGGGSPWPVSDRGDGRLYRSDGIVCGAVDYAAGLIQPASGWPTNNSVAITWAPCVPVSQAAHTLSQPVSVSTRGTVWAPNLDPLPAPGTVTARYRERGRWQTLRDNGQGVLVADVAGAGSGTLDYASGSAIATLGALPDAGTAVLWSWGSGTHVISRAGDVGIKPATIRYTTAQGSLQPGSVVVTWYQGAVAKSLTDNGAGAFSGAAGTGSVDYRTGEILVWPAAAPDVGCVVTVTYQTSVPVTGSHQESALGQTLTGTLTASLRPGSVRMQIPVIASVTLTKSRKSDKYVQMYVTLTVADNGSGGLVSSEGVSSGTVNYSTGAYSITLGTITRTVYGHSRWVSAALTLAAAGGYVIWQASVTTTAYAPAAETLPGGLTALAFDLTPTTTQAVQPGSVLFVWGGLTYVDRAGSLYHSINATTGAGTLAGAIDYTTGIATITAWTAGAGNSISVQGLLTRLGDWTAIETDGVLPGSPVRPGSTSVRANRPDGTLISAVAAADGSFSAAGVRGTVEVSTGIYRLEWGATIGGTWAAIGVLPETIRFNTVVEYSLPSDAALIGLAPERLPVDGEVPMFRAGGTELVLVHETTTMTLPAGLTAGQTLTLTLDDLMAVELRDQSGAQVSYGLFDADLDAGTVTMASPLNLSGYTQPLIARMTRGTLAQCTDVQLDGTLTLGTRLRHAYTTAARVSSMLQFGDLQARWSVLFDQSTWDGVTFADTVTGSVATGTFNATGNLLLTNRDAITERWALKFTSATQFVVIGETLGQLAGTYSISADCAPLNPYTGQPYFTLKAAGFGSGWATGNAIRLNTVGAQAAAWLLRCIRPGADALALDQVRVAAWGDG